MGLKATINLALQGGGAHGAFTWGVLDRLLDETGVEIEAVSATSAGAMNAAALKSGLVKGSRQAAKDALARFWGEVSGLSHVVPDPVRDWITSFAPPLSVINEAAELNPAYLSGDYLTRAFSPYVLNPLNVHPLRKLVEQFDFSDIWSETAPQLFIAATNVRTGKVRVFTRDEVTADAILASAALPTLSQAIEIYDPASEKEEPYWDGGYMGNPPLFPLFYGAKSRDILIVHINPIERPSMPRTARDIENRINEISFNSSLLSELRSVRFVKRLIAEGRVKADEMKDLNIHSLADDDTMRLLSVATKLSPSPALIEQLHDKGVKAADAFLSEHGDHLGEQTTCDLNALIG